MFDRYVGWAGRSYYDVKTLDLMKHVRESILEKFGDEDIYCIMLEDVDVYLTGKVEVLTERWGDKITLWVFSGTTLVDLVDVNEVGKTIENFLRANYQTTIIRKVPILEKLRLLAKVGWLLLVLRHQELTRGGEWVELTYIAPDCGKKTYLLKKEGIPLSTMVKETLDAFDVNLRAYNDEKVLIEEIERIIRYKLFRKA